MLPSHWVDSNEGDMTCGFCVCRARIDCCG